MVKYIKHISFFFALAFIAGCNPGITDSEPGVIMNVQDYFWKSAEKSSLTYEYFRVSDSSRKDYEYTFSRLSGINTPITVSEVPPLSQHTFYYKVDSVGSILAGGLSSHTLFPLPEGYEVAAGKVVIDTSYEKLGTKKVIALDGGNLIALRDDDAVYFSNSGGERWRRSEYDNEIQGAITAWTKVPSGKSYIVYAGTSKGSVLVSKDGGENWTGIRSVYNGKITGIATTLNEYLFVSSTTTISHFDTKIPGTTQKLSTSSEITSLALCEAGGDSGTSTTYPCLMAGTQKEGLMYFLYGKDGKLNTAKNKDMVVSITDIVATGRNRALALGNTSNKELVLLLTENGGLTWENSRVMVQAGKYLDAVPSLNASSESVVASEDGMIYYLSDFQAANDRTPDTRFTIRDISINDKVIIAAVEFVGVMISHDKGAIWVPSSSGLEKITTSNRKIDGMLTLLPSFADGLKKDDEWIAGNLSNIDVGATAVIEMSAKVFEHYSRLELPYSAGSYNDVYEVVYRCAPSDREVHTVHVFYAKDFGPILFQRYIGEKLIDQSYLKSK